MPVSVNGRRLHGHGKEAGGCTEKVLSIAEVKKRVIQPSSLIHKRSLDF